MFSTILTFLMTKYFWLIKLIREFIKFPTQNDPNHQISNSPQNDSTTRHATFSYSWTIDDFVRYCQMAQTTEILSARFNPPAEIELQLPADLKRTQFELSLKPNGVGDFMDCVSIFVCLTSIEHGQAEVPVHLNFFALNAQGEKVYRKGCTRNNLNSDFKNWGRRDWIKRVDLLDPKRGCIVEGKLIVSCEISFLIHKSKLESDVLAEERLIKLGEKQIMDNLTKLWDTRADNSDISLEFSNGREIKAHKAILVARSQVFAEMFRCTQKSQKNRIKFMDIYFEVGQKLLFYLYTGKVEPLDKHFVVDLLYVAEKFQLDHLKSVCEQKLCTLISSDKARIIRLAHLVRTMKLFRAAQGTERQN